MEKSKVFSTYVEMILDLVHLAKSNYRILHVCGDDPSYIRTNGGHTEYSPRMWR